MTREPATAGGLRGDAAYDLVEWAYGHLRDLDDMPEFQRLLVRVEAESLPTEAEMAAALRASHPAITVSWTAEHAGRAILAVLRAGREARRPRFVGGVQPLIAPEPGHSKEPTGSVLPAERQSEAPK